MDETMAEKFIRNLKTVSYIVMEVEAQIEYIYADGWQNIKGIGIFGDTFKELYYDRQRNDA